jgi:hypothetical protein
MAIAHISIPDGLSFDALQLARDRDGHVSFSWEPIEAICAASNMDIAHFRDAPEDNVAGLIMAWYAEHLAHGGEHDKAADDLIAETMLENQHGGGFSHKPGAA